MKVAVITPYYKEDEVTILRCVNSVKAQTHKDVTHLLVADGYPHFNHAAWGVEHMIIPNCGDFGDTPRAIGAAIASTREFDAIAFLDADNWYEPDHIEEAIKHMSKPIVTTGRNLRRVDGSLLAPCPESDGINFCDTNCYLIHRNAFAVLGAWTFKEKKKYGGMGDRLFWHGLPKEHVVRSPKYTVNYTTTYAVHYLFFNEKPPQGSKLNGLPVSHGPYA